MRFRVTDELDWQFGFDADTAEYLADGIRRACALYAEGGGTRTLRLHVHGRTNSPKGIWLTPVPHNPVAPAVSASGATAEWCARHISHAARMVKHHENLWALGDNLSAVIEEVQAGEAARRGQGGN